MHHSRHEIENIRLEISTRTLNEPNEILGSPGYTRASATGSESRECERDAAQTHARLYTA